jgi:hypothetical protein
VKEGVPTHSPNSGLGFRQYPDRSAMGPCAIQDIFHHRDFPGCGHRPGNCVWRRARLTKRLFPGKVFDRPQDIEVLQMDLSGKKIDPSDMY